MTLTRHRFRLAIGLLICVGGLVLCFSPGRLLPRLIDGAAWLFVGGILCFVQEFHLRFSRDWFTLGLGLILAVLGIAFTLVAVSAFFGSRAHGLLPFYEFIGIGPLMLTTGVLIGFDKKRAG
jgi:peptidoglycan/LPS O-acetylase OafA/YrhL